MDRAGVDRAILVPPHWVGDNNEYAVAAAARDPAHFRVVGRFNPKASGAEAHLENWLRQPQMAGIRVTFHTEPFANWLDDGSLDWFWNACQRLGIPVMALVPGMVKKLWPVVERHRHLTILIPHMGAISGLRGAGAFGSLDDLIYLARYPRVFVMVSSAPCYSDERYPFRDIQSFLRRIFDAYGARRMLWGSDISRLTCPYRVCLDHIQCLDFLSSEDKEWIVGKTLAEVLNWPEDRPRAAGK